MTLSLKYLSNVPIQYREKYVSMLCSEKRICTLLLFVPEVSQQLKVKVKLLHKASNSCLTDLGSQITISPFW